MSDTDTAAQQGAAPDPALKVFDRFIGTWDMQGRTLDSNVPNMTARASYEWLPGGFFVLQRFQADFMGMEIDSFEVIGYDPETGTFPSTVYSNMVGTPLSYRWEIDGDEVKITTEELGATFRGEWSEDGARLSGGWRPIPGREGPGNVPYDIWGGRARNER